MSHDQSIIMIHAFLTGQMSDREQESFQTWLDESEANQVLFKDYQEAWQLSGSYAMPSFESAGARAEMPFIGAEESASADVNAAPTNAQTMQRLGIAASVLVVLAAALWMLGGFDQKMRVAIGSDTDILKLEDGTIVHLRDDAWLEYPERFRSGKRVVELEEGEAYFDVASDFARRFVVETDHADITVLGTEFDVDLHEDILEVHVAEGKVRIDPEDSDMYLELTGGQSAFFDDRTGELKRVRQSDMNDIAWHTGRFTFRNEHLADVAVVLEEAFDVDITIENPELARCGFTSNYEDSHLSEILSDMVRLWDCKVIQEDNKSYTLRGGSCY